MDRTDIVIKALEFRIAYLEKLGCAQQPANGLLETVERNDMDITKRIAERTHLKNAIDWIKNEEKKKGA